MRVPDSVHLLIERQGVAAAGKLRMETDNSLIELLPACVVLNHDMFAEPIRAGLAFQAQPHRRMAHCTAARNLAIVWLPIVQATQGTRTNVGKAPQVLYAPTHEPSITALHSRGCSLLTVVS